MKCEKYKSKEAFFGVEGIPSMTSPFWDCEPEDEDIVEYYLTYLEDNNDLLGMDFPQVITLYCDECESEFTFDATPKDVFSREELYEENKKAIEKWLKNGEIDETDLVELNQENENLLKGKK